MTKYIPFLTRMVRGGFLTTCPDLENESGEVMPGLHKIGQDIVKTALKTVDPYYLMREQISVEGSVLRIKNGASFDLDQFSHIYVTGMGKGSAPMAAAVEELLGSRIDEGAVVVKYGHTHPLNTIRLYEAGHPVPDENTLTATKPLLQIADQASEKDLVIVLITGGGSALLESLPEGIGLKELSETNRQLLASGAAIHEINTIRKHISQVKGGRLAARIAPASALALILSDVIGDPLESIASGPTSPDPTTFSDAITILHKYGLERSLPRAVIRHLQQGLEGRIEDTPKASSPVFRKVHNMVIGNNRLVLERVKMMAEEYGYTPLILTDRVQGEARELAKLLSGMIMSVAASGFPVKAPGCLILGGEPTVTLKGNGLGGRNQELVLAVLTEMGPAYRPFYFCSVGTDGTDGPTDAAGAWIDDATWKTVREREINPAAYLENNDAYHFFEAVGQLIKTGPTRTNVMDLIFCLIPR